MKTIPTRPEDVKEALIVANETNAKYKQAVEDLVKENDLLTSVVTLHKLGKITEKHRELIRKIKEVERENEKIKAENKSITDEYNIKQCFLNDKTQKLKEKESDLDSFISKEARKRIKNKIKECDTQLSRHIAEYNKKTEEKIGSYQKIIKILVYVAIIGVVIGTVGIIINFV